jgi:hypothetical protein
MFEDDREGELLSFENTNVFEAEVPLFSNMGCPWFFGKPRALFLRHSL